MVKLYVILQPVAPFSTFADSVGASGCCMYYLSIDEHACCWELWKSIHGKRGSFDGWISCGKQSWWVAMLCRACSKLLDWCWSSCVWCVEELFLRSQEWFLHLPSLLTSFHLHGLRSSSSATLQPALLPLCSFLFLHLFQHLIQHLIAERYKIFFWDCRSERRFTQKIIQRVKLTCTSC